MGIAGCVLSLIIILLCIVLIAKKPNPNPELESLSKQYDELKVEKADLQTQYDNLQLDYNDLNVRYQHLLTKENAQTKTLRIDVDKYSQGQPLMTTKEYTITIKEGQSNFNGNGKWILTNVDITKGKDTDVQITITPTGKGQVTLEYESDNCTCPKRTFNIQTPTDKVDVSFSLEITPDQDSVLVGSRYTITVKGYDGEIDEWRYFGCKGDKKSKLTTEITIVNDGMSKEAIITFVPKGMKVEEARKHQIRRPIKL